MSSSDPLTSSSRAVAPAAAVRGWLRDDASAEGGSGESGPDDGDMPGGRAPGDEDARNAGGGGRALIPAPRALPAPPGFAASDGGDDRPGDAAAFAADLAAPSGSGSSATPQGVDADPDPADTDHAVPEPADAAASGTASPGGEGAPSRRDQDSELFGLVESSGALLGLPVACVREVTSVRKLSPMPGSAPGLRGALDLRGDIIPVLALDALLGLPPSTEAAGVIVIVRHERWLVGLMADNIHGMKRAAADEAPALAGAPQGLADRAFLVDGRSATVLNPAALLALPGLPRVAERARRRETGFRHGVSDALLTFRRDGVRLAIEALRVEAAVPRSEVVTSALTCGWCFGHIVHHGRRVPVLDTLALLGIGEDMPPPSRTEALVLRLGDDLLAALAIDAVCDIRRVAPEELAPLPRLAGGGFFAALLPETDAETLVIDLDALASDPAVRAVARGAGTDTERDPSSLANGDARRGSGSADPRPYLLFRAGADYAVPLEMVSEIIPFPVRTARLPTRALGLLGGFAHRGFTVPLFDLSTLLGGGGEDHAAFVLLVGEGRAQQGYAIESLSSVEPGNWRVDTRADIVGDARNMVLVGAGRAARLMTGIDLAAFAVPDEVQPICSRAHEAR